MKRTIPASLTHYIWIEVFEKCSVLCFYCSVKCGVLCFHLVILTPKGDVLCFYAFKNKKKNPTLSDKLSCVLLFLFLFLLFACMANWATQLLVTGETWNVLLSSPRADGDRQQLGCPAQSLSAAGVEKRNSCLFCFTSTSTAVMASVENVSGFLPPLRRPPPDCSAAERSDQEGGFLWTDCHITSPKSVARLSTVDQWNFCPPTENSHKE